MRSRILAVAALVCGIGLTACTAPTSGNVSLPPAGCYSMGLPLPPMSVTFNGGTAVYNTAVHDGVEDCQGTITDYWHIVAATDLSSAALICTSLGFTSGPDQQILLNLGFPDSVWRCRDLF